MIILRIGNKRIRLGKDNRKKASPTSSRTTSSRRDIRESARPSNTKKTKATNKSMRSFSYADMLKFSARIISILTIFSLVAGFTIRILPTSSRTPKVIANAKGQRGVIYLNPAGGGKDNGVTNGDRKAKDDNLELALGVKGSLEKKNFKVIISRTSDKDVKDADRIAKANKNEANFMVTIDRDKAKIEEPSGINAYVNTNKDLKSQYLAAAILNEVNTIDTERKKGILHIGRKGNPDKNYLVNSKPKMPSCVILAGSITSKSDNELIDKKKKECSEAIANGIESAYYKIYNSGEEVNQENVNSLAENDFIKEEEKEESEKPEESSEEKPNNEINSSKSEKESSAEKKKNKENPDKYDDSEDAYGDLM